MPVLPVWGSVRVRFIVFHRNKKIPGLSGLSPILPEGGVDIENQKVRQAALEHMQVPFLMLIP
jgi:hypothetical protein